MIRTTAISCNMCHKRYTNVTLVRSTFTGESLALWFKYNGVIAAKTDIFPNWYVAVDGTSPRILESTKGESLDFIGPFTSKVFKLYFM